MNGLLAPPYIRMTVRVPRPPGWRRSTQVVLTTLRPAAAVPMVSTVGFICAAFRCESPMGETVLWCLLQTDADDRKREEARYAGERRLLEMVARGHSRAAVLDALCRLVENTAGGCYCSVLLVDASGTRLEYGAAPSLPASFINSIVGRTVQHRLGSFPDGGVS